MIEDLEQEDSGRSGVVYCQWLETELEVWIEEDVTVEYANFCAKALSSMNDQLIDDLCKAAIVYAEDFCELVGQEPPKVETVRDILRFIDFYNMLVDEPEDSTIPVVHLTGNCEWEPEHGVEVVIRDGKLMYVGAHNGEWAWGEPDHYEEDYNYAFVAK